MKILRAWACEQENQCWQSSVVRYLIFRKRRPFADASSFPGPFPYPAPMESSRDPTRHPRQQKKCFMDVARKFDENQTLSNIKRMQHVACNNVARCCMKCCIRLTRAFKNAQKNIIGCHVSFVANGGHKKNVWEIMRCPEYALICNKSVHLPAWVSYVFWVICGWFECDLSAIWAMSALCASCVTQPPPHRWWSRPVRSGWRFAICGH